MKSQDNGLVTQVVNGVTYRQKPPAQMRQVVNGVEYVEPIDPLPTQVVNGKTHRAGKMRFRDHLGEPGAE